MLTDHQDEVWHLQFAHKGHMLASASKDGTAIVWDIGGPRRRVERRRVLRAHSGAVQAVAWSPDDSKLATCGPPWLMMARLYILPSASARMDSTRFAWYPDSVGGTDSAMHGSVQRNKQTWLLHRVCSAMVEGKDIAASVFGCVQPGGV